MNKNSIKTFIKVSTYIFLSMMTILAGTFFALWEFDKEVFMFALRTSTSVAVITGAFIAIAD